MAKNRSFQKTVMTSDNNISTWENILPDGVVDEIKVWKTKWLAWAYFTDWLLKHHHCFCLHPSTNTHVHTSQF